MITCRVKNISIQILFLFFIFLSISYSQLQYNTKVNTSTLGQWNLNNIGIQGNNNVFITYRRGNGTGTADREIKVACSTDQGKSFNEKDITMANNTSTSGPIIASTSSSIVVLYMYDDSSSNEYMCIARSINQGNTFSLSTETNKYFINAFHNIYSPNYSSGFLSDGASCFYLMGGFPDGEDGLYLFVSTDNGASFHKATLPTNPKIQPNSHSYHLTVANNVLWFIYSNYGSSDTTFAYRSTNNGSSWQYVAKLDFLSNSYTGNYDKAMYIGIGNNLKVTYITSELSLDTLKSRIITNTSIGQPYVITSERNNEFASMKMISAGDCQMVDFYGYSYKNIIRSYGNEPDLTWSRVLNYAVEIPLNVIWGCDVVNDSILYIRWGTNSPYNIYCSTIKWNFQPIPYPDNDTAITENGGK